MGEAWEPMDRDCREKKSMSRACCSRGRETNGVMSDAVKRKTTEN